MARSWPSSRSHLPGRRRLAEPITTEIVRYGLRVVVLGIPAPEMLKTQEALRFIGPEAFGYDGVPYVPLPGRFGAALPA